MTSFRSTYIFFKTGYSNSRLSGNFFTPPQPELSFDGMTIVKKYNDILDLIF